MAVRQDAAIEAAVEAAMAQRSDGWSNVISGFGQASRDKRTQTTFCADMIDDSIAAELWRGDDLAARAVETWPNEMLRAGWEICVGGDGDKDVAEEVQHRCEEIGLDEAIRTAMCYQRAYGGGAVLMGIKDGRLPSQPVNLPTVQGIDWLTTLEPREIQPRWYYSNPMAPKFGEVETWQVTPVSQGEGRDFSMGSTVEIHESRLLIFNGVRVSRLQHGIRPYWGDSVFARIFRALRDFNAVFDSIGVLLNEMGTPIWEVDNLAQIVTSKDSNILATRVKAMDFCKSVIRAIVIAKGEVYRRDAIPLTGVPEVMDRMAQKLAAAMDMPMTLMMKQTPGGLNSAGDNEMRGWYDSVSGSQDKRLRQPLKRVVGMLWDGKEPEVWSIGFKPLWQPTEKEQAETRKIVVETTVAAIDAQMVTPEEGRQSLYGGDKFSMEIQLDETLVAPEDFQEPPAPVAPGMPPGAGGDEPPPDGGGSAPPKGEKPAAPPEKPQPKARTDWNPDQERDAAGRWGAGGSGAIDPVEHVAGYLKAGKDPSDGLDAGRRREYEKGSKARHYLPQDRYEKASLKHMQALHAEQDMVRRVPFDKLDPEMHERMERGMRQAAEVAQDQSPHDNFDTPRYHELVTDEFHALANEQEALRHGIVNPMPHEALDKARGTAAKAVKDLDLSSAEEAHAAVIRAAQGLVDVDNHGLDTDSIVEQLTEDTDHSFGDDASDEEQEAAYDAARAKYESIVAPAIAELDRLQVTGLTPTDIELSEGGIAGLRASLEAMSRGEEIPDAEEIDADHRRQLLAAAGTDEEGNNRASGLSFSVDDYEAKLKGLVDSHRQALVETRAQAQRALEIHEAAAKQMKASAKEIGKVADAAHDEWDKWGEDVEDSLASDAVKAAYSRTRDEHGDNDPPDDHPALLAADKAINATKSQQSHRETTIDRTTINADDEVWSRAKTGLRENISTYKKVITSIDKALGDRPRPKKLAK